MLTLLLSISLSFAQERVERVAFTSTEVGFGDPDAAWTIVQFSDWQCPHCARAHDRLARFVEEDPSVQVVFKTFPLSGECNPTLTSSGHARCVLAWGAACAAEQGRWSTFAAWAFEDISRHAGSTTETLLDAAEGLGMNPTALRECLSSHRPRVRVQADAVEGARLKITGTPTFFVRDPARGDWVRATGGADGAITMLRALRDGEVERGD